MFPMLKTNLLVGASLLFAFSASAAPLHPTRAVTETVPLVRAHMVCDDYGNCYRTHPRRYVERRYYYDDDAGYEPRYYRPRYYAPRVGVYSGYGYYGPSFGFSVGTW
jgi:hypothetical protein